jgi:outer membrane protein assembly factor BamB
MEGELVWHKSVGVESDPFKWGGGSSPVLFDNFVIVNAGNEGSAIVAFDKADGREVWRVDNEGFKNSWSTPLVVEAAGRSELVFIMPDRIFALDPRSGAELWTCTSPISQTVCASLTAGDGVVYAMGGRGGRAIAVRCGGSGDVTETHIVWDSNLRAGIDTPVLYNGRLYWQVGGKAVCASAETGEELYNEALAAPDPDSKAKEGRRGPAGDYASPIVVGDKVLLVMRSGAAYVLEASGVFQVVSSNSFADDPGPFHATPAFADGQLFLRSYDKLYCIGAQ